MPHPQAHYPLNPETFAHAVQLLCQEDQTLKRIVNTYGPPPFWHRPEGFPTLIWIILEQKVSLASAKAVFDRLVNAVESLSPHALLQLEDPFLRNLGFSWQKVSYAKNLASAIDSGTLDLKSMAHLENEEIQSVLTSVKGIGPWTAEVYLLMALRRPDIWPIGDLALVRALQDLGSLKTWPKPAYLTVAGEPWRPWRSVATRILWHYYLSKRG